MSILGGRLTGATVLDLFAGSGALGLEALSRGAAHSTFVELAAPSPGLRRGRRVCAGAVSLGVLLCPLGDVVVLMPPLTITAEEIVRIVDALDGALEDVAPA